MGAFLCSVSVGCIPNRWKDGASAAPQPLSLECAPATGTCRSRYLEQELLEVSAVPIPANPNALALAVKAGAVQKSDLRETLDLLRQMCRPEPATLKHQPLLALARELHALLRRF